MNATVKLPKCKDYINWDLNKPSSSYHLAWTKSVFARPV